MQSPDVCLVCLDLDYTREGWQLSIKDNMMEEYSLSFNYLQLYV